jgi:hypothetical protein
VIIEKQHHRNRVVKGWAFMNLDEATITAIEKFLATGNTDDLPERFQRRDYSIYLGK